MTDMKRVYEQLVGDHFAKNRQMAFLSGPRQVGKTTLANALLPNAKYYNYDRPKDALLIGAGPDSVADKAGIASPALVKNGIVFDELHKFSGWKRFLKGFFDVYGRGLRVAVTGLHYVRDKQQREVDFLIAKDGEPYMLVECKTSLDESLSPALLHFNGVLKPRYAVQVAIEADGAGINPLEYEGRPIKVSAADFLAVFI